MGGHKLTGAQRPSPGHDPIPAFDVRLDEVGNRRQGEDRGQAEREVDEPVEEPAVS